MIEWMTADAQPLSSVDFHALRPLTVDILCAKHNLLCYGFSPTVDSFTDMEPLLVPLVVFSEWLGHRDVKRTRQVYARISGRFSADQMAKVGELWALKQKERQVALPLLPTAVSTLLPRVATQGGNQVATSGNQARPKLQLVEN